MAVTPSNYQSEQVQPRNERSFNKCGPNARKFKNNRRVDENNPNGGLSGSQSFRQIQKLTRQDYHNVALRATSSKEAKHQSFKARSNQISTQFVQGQGVNNSHSAMGW